MGEAGVELIPELKHLHDECYSETGRQLLLGMTATLKAESEQKRRRVLQVEGELERKGVDGDLHDACKIAQRIEVDSCVDQVAHIQRGAKSLDLQVADATAQVRALEVSLETLQEEASQASEHLTMQNRELVVAKARLDSRVGIAAFEASGRDGTQAGVMQLHDQVACLEAHLHAEVKHWDESLSTQQLHTSQLHEVVDELRKQQANLKANVTSQVKECGEKTELLTRRSVALEAKSADIERLSLEIQALGRSLDQNNVDLRKKNLWASEAREEAVQTVEELKKTEFELALLRSELAKAVAALSDRYLAAHAHRQSVSEASVETDTLEGEVSRSTEQEHR